jgi:hypothetical protein
MNNPEKSKQENSSQPFEKILFTIENVFNLEAISLDFGDIFVTEDGIYFIVYDRVIHFGKLKSNNALSTGNMVAGFGFGVATSGVMQAQIKQ